jgi:tetratricopeptide (TPR) repeat protein
MGKLSLLIVILVFIALALFAFFNQGDVTVNVPFWKSFDLRMEYLLFLSSMVGALVMLLLFAIRDTKRFMVSYQEQRKQKKDEKIQALYSKAVTAILADDQGGAQTLLEQVLKVEPGHTDALLRLGDLATENEHHDEAASIYRRAHTSDPKNLEALFSLASSMVAQRQWDQALGYVEKILELDPINLSALYRKRSLVERKGRWDDVLDIQKTILRYEHHSSHLKREQINQLGFRYEMGRESLEAGEFDKASKTFKAILKDEKGFIPAHLGVAEVLLGSGDTEGAVTYLEEAYEATRSQIILVRLEDMLINLGEPGRLLSTYRKAVAERPDDDQLKFFLGKVYFRLEMVDDALDTLKDLDGQEWPDLHKLLGELYLRRDRCDLAVEQFKKTLEMRSSFRLPYCCSVCGRMEDEWSGRCSDCGHWNTFNLTIHGVCKV